MTRLKSVYSKNRIEAGCDEAGRGCLAGPVFAAAVILPPGYRNKFLNDSKKLSPSVREQLRAQIQQDAIAHAVAKAEPAEIDEINILWASILAMHRALDLLAIRPELILVDGNHFKPYHSIPHQCIIRGDATYKSIAAASILAKTYRDDYMAMLHEKFPHYGWDQNKGYPTEIHQKAILNFGISPFHRKSFCLGKQLKLEL